MESSPWTLYTHATIITLDGTRRIFLDGAILVHGNRIATVDKTSVLLNESLPGSTKVIDCSERIILPGFINIHAHLGQSLLRGLAEDVPLHTWLCDYIWPLEAAYESEDGYVAAKLTVAEMLKSGTTCFLEAMLTHSSGFDNVVRVMREMGIRGCLGKLVKVEKPDEDVLQDPRDRDLAGMSVGSALEAHRAYNGSCNDRVRVWMAASTPRGSPASSWKMIGDACSKHRISLTMHCAEAPKDLHIFRDSYNCSPMEFCAETNLFGEGRNTVLAHMVNLDMSKDLPLLRHNGVAVAHNPASNCKLASGIAPIPEMLDHGINVGLGTDGAPCDNTYDMFSEMRLASLIHKGKTRNAQVVGANSVLEMATINGAKALGLEQDLGSIEVGKKADFVVVDSRGLHCAPFNAEDCSSGGVDPITTVVYSCTRGDVDMVVVDGEILVEHGALTRCNETEIVKEARAVVKRIRSNAGIGAAQNRNWVR